MKALVLGATGFIGGQIARAALEVGWSVRALRRRPNAVGALGDVADQVEWTPGSLSGATLPDVMRGCDVVFHAAAFYAERNKDVAGSVRRGVSEMRQVLGAFAESGAGRLIYTSSLTTVGLLPPNAQRLADERDFFLPHSTRSAYYESKYAMEMEAYRVAAQGLDVVVLCPTAVFGPGDVKPTTGQVLLEVARGRMPASVDATMNVVDGRDLASAHVAAAQRGKMGGRYIIGGHNVTLHEALTLAAQEAGVAPPRWQLPRKLVLGLIRAVNVLPWALLPENARMMSHWQALNTNKAQRELGLAEPRSLKETIQDTLAWFRANGYLKSP